jgi:hypothetical protein
MVSGSDINATVGQAAPKSALVGLGKLGTTVDINTKAIEMDTLALHDADHHPAESFQGEHLTFAISIYTYCNKSYISVLLAKIGFSNWIPKPELFPTAT